LLVRKDKKAGVNAATRWVVLKAIGALELQAAVGLILPAVLNIARVVEPVTAMLGLLMVGATITHGRLGQGEYMGIRPLADPSSTTRSSSSATSTAESLRPGASPTFCRSCFSWVPFGCPSHDHSAA
jgi:DoxX-like family